MIDAELVDRALRFTASDAVDGGLQTISIEDDERLELVELAEALNNGTMMLVPAGRLAGAESDGLAQAVCRALNELENHGGRIPWPSVKKPYKEWLEARAGKGHVEDVPVSASEPNPPKAGR